MKAKTQNGRGWAKTARGKLAHYYVSGTSEAVCGFVPRNICEDTYEPGKVPRCLKCKALTKHLKKARRR